MSADRQPETTRRRILETAAAEIYRHGFQGAGVSEILDRTGLSKGAFYHHFATKQELGYAVVEELYAGWNRDQWAPVLEAPDPLRALIDFLARAHESLTAEALECGCPLNNLAQEMSPLDEGFRVRVQRVVTDWLEGLAEALGTSQRDGRMTSSADARDVAAFVVATVQGATSLAKTSRDARVYAQSLRGLVGYLRSLETGPGHGR